MRAFFGIFAAILAFIQIAAAVPPACLLAALGVQENPSDLKAVCGDLQHAVISNMTDACHKDTLPQAYTVYSSKCLDEGVTVSKLATATPTASSTGITSVSATTTAGPTGTSGSGSSSSPSSSTSPSATPTPSGNAGPTTQPQSFLFAAAMLLATGLTTVILL
ncbi:hypothetical protein F5Y19DRAFT_474102 [Xylariaceae sp. FL1651]|nr:hypothetical protein F5Y19DRAFT_474102 [Xylariaceae sp. FL1651]